MKTKWRTTSVLLHEITLTLLFFSHIFIFHESSSLSVVNLGSWRVDLCLLLTHARYALPLVSIDNLWFVISSYSCSLRLSTKVFYDSHLDRRCQVPMHISFHNFLVLFSLCIILKFSMFTFFITQITRIIKYKHRKVRLRKNTTSQREGETNKQWNWWKTQKSSLWHKKWISDRTASLNEHLTIMNRNKTQNDDDGEMSKK